MSGTGAADVAPCGCPIDGVVERHQSGTCTDPVVARLNWYADLPSVREPGRFNLQTLAEQLAQLGRKGHE
jgi:hypothetical protein